MATRLSLQEVSALKSNAVALVNNANVELLQDMNTHFLTFPMQDDIFDIEAGIQCGLYIPQGVSSGSDEDGKFDVNHLKLVIGLNKQDFDEGMQTFVTTYSGLILNEHQIPIKINKEDPNIIHCFLPASLSVQEFSAFIKDIPRLASPPNLLEQIVVDNAELIGDFKKLIEDTPYVDEEGVQFFTTSSFSVDEMLGLFSSESKFDVEIDDIDAEALVSNKHSLALSRVAGV